MFIHNAYPSPVLSSPLILIHFQSQFFPFSCLVAIIYFHSFPFIMHSPLPPCCSHSHIWFGYQYFPIASPVQSTPSHFTNSALCSVALCTLNMHSNSHCWTDHIKMKINVNEPHHPPWSFVSHLTLIVITHTCQSMLNLAAHRQQVPWPKAIFFHQYTAWFRWS